VKLRFTKRAVRQIEDIIEGIALESPIGARRVRERMQCITTLH
jgi:plasmid stabilization system protein ParE